MSKSDSSRAAAVSRALRAGGLSPWGSGTSRAKEGIRVTAGILGWTTVIVSIDAPGQRDRVAADVIEVLGDAGYAVTEQSRGDGWGGFVIYRVQKEA